METLFFLLEHLYHMTKIPIRCLDSSGQLTLFNKGYKPEYDPFGCGPVKNRVLSTIDDGQPPFIEVEEEVYAYGCMRDTTGCTIVIGPITILAQRPEEMKRYAKGHGIPLEHFFIANRGMLELISATSMLYFARHGKTIKGNELFAERAAERVAHEKEVYAFSNVDEEIYRESYTLERNFLDHIRQGDVSAVERPLNVKNPEAIVGKIAHNPIKRFEYMVCTSICLISRAAMEGGLAPAISYDISDIFLQRLEHCKDITEMAYLHNEVKKTFAKLVNEAQQTRSAISYVEKCKVFIAQNLTIPFTVDDIARSISINKHHLSRRFTHEEGMSIMEYARKKRVETAANMLKFSNEKISTIATYLTFSDQSHFGKVFKNVMGITPRQYRSSNQTIEVL